MIPMTEAPSNAIAHQTLHHDSQKDFVEVEQGRLKRTPEQTTAVVGYAGGRSTSPDGKVCYYYSKDPGNVYERLGHAEVVQLQLDRGSEEQQIRMFADRYFAQFKRSPFGGMQRLVCILWLSCCVGDSCTIPFLGPTG